MLDTVRLICKAQPTGEQLKEWWRKREDTQRGEPARCEYYYNPDKDAPVQVRATYRPKSRQRARVTARTQKLTEEELEAFHDQFSVEFSLPKLIFGNNHQMIEDLATAIDGADELLAQVPAFPLLPSLYEWTVSRIDICYNYLVGSLLPDYIAALSVLEYPHRDKAKINAETVEFRAKSVKCKFYDKFSECRDQAAAGLLRHETTLHRASSVKAALGRKRGTIYLTDITREACRAILEQDLRRLGILGKPLGNFDAAEIALIAAYTPSRASRLLYTLGKYQRSGRAGLMSALGQTRNFVNRSLLDIRKAGVPLALTASQYSLPPLDVGL